MTTDELKIARDGHLFYGPRNIWRNDRRDLQKPPLWLIERDAEGRPCRMWWNGPAVRAWEEAHTVEAGAVEVSRHEPAVRTGKVATDKQLAVLVERPKQPTEAK